MAPFLGVLQPLQTSIDFFPLVRLGLARFLPLEELFSPNYVDRLDSRDIDRVLGIEPDGLVRVRMRGTGVPQPEIYANALEAFTASADDEPLTPVLAEWFREQRAPIERLGVLSSSAWCISCGRHFIDARVGRGLVTRIAKWCPGCRHKETRHLPALRLCAAPDCYTWFSPTRSNHLFHRPACKEAARVGGEDMARWGSRAGESMPF